jgi:hypothetical protein
MAKIKKQKWTGTYRERNLTKGEVAACLEGCLKTFRDKASEGKYNFVLIISQTPPADVFVKLPQMEDPEVTS